MNLKGKGSSDRAEELLSIPRKLEGEQVERASVAYTNESKKFALWDNKDVTRQYCKMYATRLEKTRFVVEQRAREKWGSDVSLKYLHDLRGDCGRCVVIGTLFKKQELKPSILREISEEHQLMPQPVAKNYVSKDDELILEDEVQRIQLVGNIEVAKLVTGVVCAVVGEEDERGKFSVEDICFAGLPDSLPREVIDQDRHVLLVSGLELSCATDHLLPLELMVDYVTGQIGSSDEQTAVSLLTRVIIAGNSISSRKGDKDKPDKLKVMKELDDILTQIASVCPVDVMPGEFDPTNHVLPQQPLHRCMLPKAGVYSTMQSVTNPYEFEVGGRVMLGTSGQNVMDVCRCTALEDPLDVLQELCEWGHLAPTAPDTLPSYPFYQEEPFIMTRCPDILFAGNQESFCSRVVEVSGHKVTVVSVPRFNSTSTCVLVNLKTLECQPMEFSIGLSTAGERIHAEGEK